MSPHALNISIDDAGLNAIYGAGQSIALAKGASSIVDVQYAHVTANRPIAWLVFKPYQVNCVTWTECYAVYASSSPLIAGTPIVANANAAAQTGLVYVLKHGQFTVAGEGPSDVFTTENQVGNGLSFGLMQQATVNNVSVTTPLCAQPVLYNQSASMAPTTTLSIFLTSVSSGGTVLYSIPSTALTLTLTKQRPTAALSFNSTTNTFYFS